VALWGGEHAGAPSSIALVYDADADALGAVPARVSPPSIARSRHFGMRVGDDAVVLGGTASQVERLPLVSFKPSVEADLPAAEAAIARLDATHVVIAGGADDPLRVQIVALGGTKPAVERTAQLPTPRRWAAAAQLGDGVLVAGGDDGTSAWVGADGTVKAGPSVAARAEACAVTLEDGRVLLVGGRSGGAPVDAAEVVGVDRSATAVSLPGGARLYASCTLLADGTVLVVGGTGPAGARADAVRFTPR
jgi:hypothetical protein